MKGAVIVILGLLLMGCERPIGEWVDDAVDTLPGDIANVQAYAANRGTETIHIFPKREGFKPSNRVNGGAKQVAMAELFAVPKGEEKILEEFAAGVDGRIQYRVTCELSPKVRTIVEYTGSSLECRYELKPGAVSNDPESGTGTTG